MAFDGITIANIVYDLNRTILNGRIAKIAQPEKDELILTIKGGNVGQARLLLSASASLPLIYLTDTNKPSPMNAPNFCMLLRKHIANGRIMPPAAVLSFAPFPAADMLDAALEYTKLNTFSDAFDNSLPV